ncbi:MAG TPA: TIGR03118 family protein [Kofleriaceae bacterium]
MTFRRKFRISRIAIAAPLFAVGCMAEADTNKDVEPSASDGQSSDLAAPIAPAATIGGPFAVVNLIADTPGLAPNFEATLQNAWGVVPFQRMFWIADNATGVLSIVDGQGTPSTGSLTSGALAVEEGITGVAATGVSPHEANLFPIHVAGVCKPALLLVASETGRVFGVNPELSTTKGFEVIDRSKAGAIYKGVTVLQRRHDKRGPLILATDFHNARIDVFDANFKLTTSVSFRARGVKKGFAPFNVMAIDDIVYVTYAKQDADAEDDVAGPGLGFVAAFSATGKFLRITTGIELNAPWGLQLALRFDKVPPSLLVGNFGDGHITALDPVTLKIRGQLADAKGAPIAIEGLWGLSLADGVTNARAGALYFASGPGDEAHGLFGLIAPSRP